MNKTNAVFNEYIFENTIEDFANEVNYIVGSDNLNENEIDCNELLYDIKGDSIKVIITFADERDFDDMFIHPVNRMKIKVEISDISLTGYEKKIYECLNTFVQAMNKTIIVV